MTRLLVVWEDNYRDALGLFVTRRLSMRVRAGDAFPKVLFHTCRGNGNFAHYVSSTWRNVRGKGLPGDPGKIDHLVCVADGDRLHDVLPTIGLPPKAAADVSSWHSAAERDWNDHLRSLCDPSVAPDTVHGRVLRWSKESLALAGYDRRASMLDTLGIDIESDFVRNTLRACSPPPTDVADEAFSDTYSRPLRCLRGLQPDKAVQKNAPEIDDALRALAKNDLALICKRVPDLERLVDLILELSSSTTPVAAPSPT